MTHAILTRFLRTPGWQSGCRKRLLVVESEGCCYFLTAILFASLTVPVASSQNLHSEFEMHGGSSLRAGLLYDSLIEGPARQTAAPDPSRPEDPWIAFDKAEHVTFGFLFTLGTQYVLVNKFSARERGALPLSVGVAAAAGVGKELYDRKYGSGHFSRRDLVADAAGIALAVVVVLL